MSGVSIYDAGGGAPPHPAEAMELAARHLDRMLSLDASTATLGDRLQGGGLLGGGGVSGLQVSFIPLKLYTFHLCYGPLKVSSEIALQKLNEQKDIFTIWKIFVPELFIQMAVSRERNEIF